MLFQRRYIIRRFTFIRVFFNIHFSRSGSSPGSPDKTSKLFLTHNINDNSCSDGKWGNIKMSFSEVENSLTMTQFVEFEEH